MLRITIHDVPESLTFQLEGKLVGPWVQEAENCWQRTIPKERKPVCFDLTGVIMIDLAAKRFLAAAHALGVEFLSSGCLMRAVLADITKRPIADCECS